MAHWNHFYYGQARYDEPDSPVKIIIERTSMYDLHRTMTNPFDDPNLGMDRLIAFTSAHLTAMNSNNPGGFLTTRITATTSAFAGVNSAFVLDQDKLGLRKAMKLLKDRYRETLPAGVGRIAGAVAAKFGETSSQMLQCFPQGRSIFTKCKDDMVGSHLQTMIDGVTALQAQLGAPVVTDATALLTGWTAVYTPSESASGAKDTSKTVKNNARAALQLELFKNLLTMALQYPRQPEMLDVYMQQSLLETHPAAPAAPAPTPTPAPGK
jgi:hypothetical protein